MMKKQEGWGGGYYTGLATIDGEGKIVTEGGQILIGGNDSYIAMCHSCWKQAIAKQRNP